MIKDQKTGQEEQPKLKRANKKSDVLAEIYLPGQGEGQELCVKVEIVSLSEVGS